MSLSFVQTGAASGILRDGHESVAEIRDLHLCHMLFRPGGARIINETYPLPLYWRQYQEHQHPERNTGAEARLEKVLSSPEEITLECSGATFSGSAASTVRATFARLLDPVRYQLSCAATLRIPEGRKWEVTFNPDHGELEFCNLWPAETFAPAGSKRYSSCCVLAGGRTVRIPHHHLESSDKHNIELERGDRFCWVLEEENPLLEILSPGKVSAGLCAYMWDAHFAYSVCPDGMDRYLPGGTHYDASYMLRTIPHAEAEALTASAVGRVDPEAADVPVVLPGLHTFRETFGSFTGRGSEVWPWEREVSEGDQNDAGFALDRTTGTDDNRSLRISSRVPVSAAWKASAYGPAFGSGTFPDGARYRLSGMVRTSLAGGHASLALRLHRPGRGEIFQVGTYELYPSAGAVEGESGWTRLEVTTPPINPAPDRIHVLLLHKGRGTTWFDDTLLEVLE